MKATYEDRLTMYTTVQSYLEDNNTTWNTITAINTAVTDFNQAVQNIRETLQVQIIPTTGAATDKQAAKNTLSLNCEVVANLIHAYASAINNNELLEEANYPLSKLKTLRDNVLIETADNILNIANFNAAALADYGLTPAMITALTDARDAFANANTRPRIKIVNRKTATDAFKGLFQQVDNILNNRLDNLISQFKLSNISFYEGYENARIIVNTTPGNETTVIFEYSGEVAPSATINAGTLEPEATRLQLRVNLGGPLEFGLSIDGSNFDGNTNAIGGPGITTIEIEDFNSTGNIILVRNQNPSGTGGFLIRGLE